MAWLERVVFPMAEERAADLIFQVGDLGWWPRIATNDSFRALARRAPYRLTANETGPPSPATNSVSVAVSSTHR